MPNDPLIVAAQVAAALEQVGVPYLIGGSLASTLHGEPRATFDVDVAAHLELQHVDALIEALGDEYIVDRDGLVEAVERSSMVNLVRLAPMTKVDLYVRPREGLFAAEIQRATRVRLLEDPPAEGFVATPEDTVLQKLRWYRQGEEVSDRQWRDVLGVLKAKRNSLDRAYMTTWAQELGLDGLLQRAWRESGHALG